MITIGEQSRKEAKTIQMIQKIRIRERYETKEKILIKWIICILGAPILLLPVMHRDEI